MVEMQNINALSDEYIDDVKFVGLVQTLYLGHASGTENIYINIDVIKPGGKSAKLHSHSAQEEFFLVLSGSGTLRINDKRFDVFEGDFFSKPPGRGIAHQFINNNDEPLKILDVGTTPNVDIITYPDEGVILIKPERRFFAVSNEIDDFSTDPNE